jgi:hypothetical protein
LPYCGSLRLDGRQILVGVTNGRLAPLSANAQFFVRLLSASGVMEHIT